MSVILFYITAVAILLFAFLSVTTRRILRAAVYLLFVLIGTAAIYFLLRYNFLAALQLTLYAGGIIVLIIFSIMLTSQMNNKLEKPNDLQVVLASVTSVVGVGLVLFVILNHSTFITQYSEKIYNVKEVALSLISYQKNGYALPFEVISVLLLAAMVAAIIMAKRELKNKEQ
ncbi:MAG: NADH-quinone oxidoreductase subunit J [Flavobacteriales bacterium]|nr:NADH-quinone oxidoreductase subunit J [Flavobacteriales bacterium]